MKVSIMWKISPAHCTTAFKRFLKTGAPAPKGLKTIGRWHSDGSSRGFHLVEGCEAALADRDCVLAATPMMRQSRSDHCAGGAP